MAYDYSKLAGRIVEKFGSRKAFAKAYGISLNSVSKKLNGKMGITKADIEKMSQPDLLDIPAEEIHKYFFKVKVQ